MRDERQNRAALAAECLRRLPGKTPERDEAHGPYRSHRQDLSREDTADRLRDAKMGPDGYAKEAKRHRPGEKEGADVVATAQIQGRARESFERLGQRDPGSEEKRHLETGRPHDGEDDKGESTTGRAHE